MTKAKLYLIPNFIGSLKPELAFPPCNYELIKTLRHFSYEHLKDARRFLVNIGLKEIIDKSEFYPLDKRSSHREIQDIITILNAGHHFGVLSDAGVPCVADPGSKLVKAAHYHNIQVVPLIGPSSILMALMSSGLNGQSFAFHGYLERDDTKRQQQIKQLEAESKKRNQTQLIMDTPYRNVALYEHLIRTLQSSTQLSLAVNLHSPQEWIKTLSVKEWKQNKIPDLHKQPALFSFLA